jgi:3-oxoacyl-[acyl-carrier protein] reductase
MGGYQVKNDLMQRLANSRALVTGGSRGIGAAVARRLATEGAAVTITYYRHAEQARALVAELAGAGHTAFAFHCDCGLPQRLHARRRRRLDVAAPVIYAAH